MMFLEQKLYRDSQKSGQENSGNGVEKTEDMNVCGGYRTESFHIIVWKRYDKKNTVPILFRYIGNDNDTIKRYMDTRLPRNQEMPGTTQASYCIPGTTCIGYFDRVVRVHGEHVRHVSVDSTELYGHVATTSEYHCGAHSLFLSNRCALAVV